MTGEEWSVTGELTSMLTFLELGGHRSNRKLRLFAVACCRRIWSELRDERSRKAVETAEAFADGLATLNELRADFEAAYAAVDDCQNFSPFSEDQAIAAYLSAARNITESDTRVPEAEDMYEVVAHTWSYAIDGDRKDSEFKQCRLLRCIVGNPFRPASLDPSRRTSTVIALAQGIYDERAFDRLPILADALQDAGCDNDDILNHCRDTGPHARGCWVVDLVLGKK
jgi:hypothetical protein